MPKMSRLVIEYSFPGESTWLLLEWHAMHLAPYLESTTVILTETAIFREFSRENFQECSGPVILKKIRGIT